jgi:16S rRNA (guanine527-N7)-methyltransferase
MELDERTQAALAGLATSHGLSARQREQLGTLLTVLARDEHAPTAVRSPIRAADVHLGDSLVGLEFAAVRSARPIADLGAGAGFPGLPLAVALPAAEVRLVESQARRCLFIERMCAEAEIGNARVVCVRAEEWREGLASHDVVLARALAPQPVVLEYAAPLLRVGGTLLDWRGRRDCKREAASAVAARALGLQCVEVRRVSSFGEARFHHIHLYLKVRDTPKRFPRRVGIACKRPLAS